MFEALKSPKARACAGKFSYEAPTRREGAGRGGREGGDAVTSNVKAGNRRLLRANAKNRELKHFRNDLKINAITSRLFTKSSVFDAIEEPSASTSTGSTRHSDVFALKGTKSRANPMHLVPFSIKTST